METATPRKVISPEQQKTLEDAEEIAFEWATPMRLDHVLDIFPEPDISQTGIIIKAMIEDIEREGEGEIIMSREAKKAIGRRAARLFRDYLNNTIKEQVS